MASFALATSVSSATPLLLLSFASGAVAGVNALTCSAVIGNSLTLSAGTSAIAFSAASFAVANFAFAASTACFAAAASSGLITPFSSVSAAAAAASASAFAC